MIEKLMFPDEHRGKDRSPMMWNKINEIIDHLNAEKAKIDPRECNDPKCSCHKIAKDNAEECPDCQNWTPPIYDTANFCPNCGRKIEKAERCPDEIPSNLKGRFTLHNILCIEANIMDCEEVERIEKLIRLWYKLEGKPSVSGVEELRNLIVDTMNKERLRNTTATGHKYSEICSCGTCHMSNLLAHAIKEAYGK
jgi:hypothetical protein